MPRIRGGIALLLWLGTTSQAFGAQVQVPAGGSINAGLTAASPGDTVCVQGGTYYEQVSLVPGVALFGGFDAVFTWPPDPEANVTMIHGEGVRSCLVSDENSDETNVVSGFTFRGAGGMPGAAIRVDGGSPVFTNNEISENRHGGVAGGVYITGGSTVRFSNNVLRDNSSAGSGGAFRIEDSAPVIEDNLLTGNVARNSGGAFYVFNSTLTATDNTIRDGLAGNGGGAAFFFAVCDDGGVITGTTIEDCEAGNGAAIVLRDESSVSFHDTVIRRCAATSSSGGFGGGALLMGFSSLTLDEARFEDCTATADGGGIYSFRSSLKLTGPDAADPMSSSAFVNCSAQERGGALYVFAAEDTSANQITGVRFSDCSSRDGGGGFYFEECSLLFSLNVLERCSSFHGGGGSIFTAASVSPPLTLVVNNTFFECSATSDPLLDPGGALAVMGPTQSNLAYLAGNIISNTLSGACISCTGGAGVSQPSIICTTLNNDPGNPSNITSGGSCSLAFQAGAGNAAREPGFCVPSPTDYRLEDCDVEVNCDEAKNITNAMLRGATDVTCPCNFASVEESSWGQIKSRYRR